MDFQNEHSLSLHLPLSMRILVYCIRIFCYKVGNKVN